MSLSLRLTPTWTLIHETLRAWQSHNAARVGAALAGTAPSGRQFFTGQQTGQTL